jgi:hypothetical protein
MKSFLSIVILFLSVNCWGQKDTLPPTDTLGVDLSDSAFLVKSYVHFDTVKVVMLYSDTSTNLNVTGRMYGYEVKTFYKRDPSIIQKDAYGNYVNNVIDKAYLYIKQKATKQKHYCLAGN